MTFRLAPLRAAAALAAGFVVVRVVYRVLFHGADGDGAVLLGLPELRLPAPFAHVVMFGPVTTDGLWDAAASALPIAVGILAFGVLNGFVDLARVFARASRRGPLRGIARALAIAWATLPSLADAARAVRVAQRLRGERAGIRTLVPLLQRTLERAGNVAAALELRGFAGRGLEGACEAPVEAQSVELGFDEVGPRVRIDELSLAPGALTLLSGPTGAGKSTVLRALAGLHTHADGGWMTGRLDVVGHDRTAVPPRDLAERVGVVLQHPRDAFVTDRVRDEIGLALELRGVASVIVAARVAEVAERVGVTRLLDRPTRGLSAGEATLVAIAAALVEHPILLLVDEPLADLDAGARAHVVGVLDGLAHEAGVCVVVAEHRVEALADVADRSFRIDAGVVVEGPPPLPGSGRDPYDRGGMSAPRTDASRSEPEVVLRARDVTVRHRDVVAVSGVALELRAGELVALVGPNGAGKSSLLTALALPPRGADVAAPGRVALVPDASDDLFVDETVAAECARADRRGARASRASLQAAAESEEMSRNEGHSRGMAPRFRPSPRFRAHRRAAAGDTAARFAAFLGLDPDGRGFRARLARHPRDLSVGERRCLALAIQLATRPRVLLVDEPTRGLDPAARDLVASALVRLADDGAAVLVASHEPDLTALADRVVTMDAGTLGAAPAALLVQPRATTPPRLDTALGNTPLRTTRTPVQAELRHVPPAAGTRRPPLVALLAANLVALAAFCWPLVGTALPAQAHAAVPVVALALAPLAALVVVATLDGTVRSAHLLALLGTLTAIGAAVRIASTGAGGVEAVFILLILAGRAFGARFGMLLGIATIALSTAVTGSFGPWTPFQMFACAWVGAGAGLLPRRLPRGAEVALLCLYGVVASYGFGLLMNLWFWPFAVGYGTGISYEPGAPLAVNMTNFLLYSLLTSTAGWDTLRAITTVAGILIVGRPVLAALRRTKPLTSPAVRPAAARTPAPVR